jgi:metal-dependent amidase/aminoacylase/carboxypeptidase family protein
VGVDIDFYKYGAPVDNHPVLYHLFEKVGNDLFIPEKRAYITKQSMESEDFGNYTQLFPGLLIRLRMGKSSPPLHTSSFDFCDDSLVAGITILGWSGKKKRRILMGYFKEVIKIRFLN